MKESLAYNLHDIITFQINREKKNDLFPDLNLPFSYFSTNEKLTDPDIILNIGKFRPSNNNCMVIDNKYYVKNNYFYCKDQSGNASWEVEINGLESDHPIINYNGKLFSPETIMYPHLLPQDLFLQPLIEFLLFKKGYAYLHAAGVCQNNKCYVLVGRGSSFKTSICMDLLRKENFSLLGDERIMLSHDGRVLSCPIHQKTFNFKTNHLANEEFRSSGRLNVDSIKKYLRFLKEMHNSSTLKTNYMISDSADLQSIIFLNRTNFSKIHIRPITLDLAVSKLVINNMAEKIKGHTFFWYNYGQFFLKYMFVYSFVFPESYIATYDVQLRYLLSNILSKSKLYEICFKAEYDRTIIDELSRLFIG
ncbi:MAG: hypothetical protein ABC606_00790 [Candidatus Methanosuratincola petrocarbonis]